MNIRKIFATIVVAVMVMSLGAGVVLAESPKCDPAKCKTACEAKAAKDCAATCKDDCCKDKQACAEHCKDAKACAEHCKKDCCAAKKACAEDCQKDCCKDKQAQAKKAGCCSGKKAG